MVREEKKYPDAYSAPPLFHSIIQPRQISTSRNVNNFFVLHSFQFFAGDILTTLFVDNCIVDFAIQ